MKKLLTSALLAGLTLAAASSANAQDASSSFDVNLTVEASCTLSTAAASIDVALLDLDLSQATVAAYDSDAFFSVRCNRNLPYNLSLDADAAQGTVNLVDGASGQSFQARLTSNAVALGSVSFGEQLAGTGTGVTQSIPFEVSLLLPDGLPRVGTYTKTVTATVNY